MVARAPLPAAWQKDAALHSSCIAGAETVANLRTWLADAGFTAIRFTTKDDSRDLIDEWDSGKKLGELLVSAIIEATKP